MILCAFSIRSLRFPALAPGGVNLLRGCREERANAMRADAANWESQVRQGLGEHRVALGLFPGLFPGSLLCRSGT